MSEVVEREGKLFCIEPEGEWEYEQSIPKQDESPTLAEIKENQIVIMDALATLFETVMGGGS